MPEKLTITSVLDAPFETQPQPFTKRTANGTRAPTATEIGYSGQERLRGIVILPDMASDLVKVARSMADEKVRLDPKDAKHRDWLASLHPKHTPSPCSPIINSEMDTRTWIWETLLKPSLRISWSCLSMEVRYAAPDETSPFLGSISVPSNIPIPDERLYTRVHVEGPKYAEKNLQTFEFKTGNAMPPRVFKNMEERNLKPGNPGVHMVVPFKWPVTSVGLSKETKMIVQVRFRRIPSFSFAPDSRFFRFTLKCRNIKSNSRH